MLQGIINFFSKSIDYYAKIFKQMDYDHSLIHAGHKFTAFHKATIISGGTLEFSLVTPSNVDVHWRPARIKPSADKVDWQVYEGATVNVAGTQITYSNRNRQDDKTAGVVLRHGTTFTAPGTLVSGLSDWLPGSTGTGTIRNGDSVSDSVDEIVLKNNTTYRFVVTNGSTGSNVIGFIFNHYEETMNQ